MFFALGSKIIQIKPLHIVLALLIIVLAVAGIVFIPSEKAPSTETTKPVIGSDLVDTNPRDGKQISKDTKEPTKESWQVKEAKGELDEKDCTFGGKGKDAILLPSGFYYCRSNENRVTIKVDGREKICCVVP